MSQTQREMKEEIEKMWKEIPNSTARKATQPELEAFFNDNGWYGTDEEVIRYYNAVYTTNHKQNKYQVSIKGITLDVYDVLSGFNVTNPATQHAIKKLLKAGDRGYKDKVQDFNEAIESILRAIELEGE